MRRARRARGRLAPLLLLVAAAVLSALTTVHPADALDVIYIVRHAEKQARWPEQHDAHHPLSRAGEARAQALAHRLAGVDRDAAERTAAVYASATTRALATGWPTAEALGIPLIADDRTVDSAHLPAFFDDLRRRHADDHAVLIVGHSNTVPLLLRHLGGAAGCDAKLGIASRAAGQLRIQGYDGLWRVTLTRDDAPPPGDDRAPDACSHIERRSQTAGAAPGSAG
ncbi:MAG: phosphoglycerate mutase family protein [Acidobacteriota bacterium]